MDQQLLRIPEAHRYLGISRGKLYELLRSGEIASVAIGRARRIPVGELDRFIRTRLGGEGGPATSPTIPDDAAYDTLIDVLFELAERLRERDQEEEWAEVAAP